MLTIHAAAETTSTVQDDAVRAAYNQGITIVAAAGNNDVSPSSSCYSRALAANQNVAYRAQLPSSHRRVSLKLSQSE